MIKDDIAAIKAALDAGPLDDCWEFTDCGVTKSTRLSAACSPDRIARLVEHVERLNTIIGDLVSDVGPADSDGYHNGAVIHSEDVIAARAALEGKE